LLFNDESIKLLQCFQLFYIKTENVKKQ